MFVQLRQHKEMLKLQPCELRMAETMCDPILSCPRYKNLASGRLAHKQRGRRRKRRDGEMQDASGRNRPSHKSMTYE